MKKCGFTLIELSIVLVLLGLLVGGVLAGRSVIRSSEIRNTLTDLEAYKAAFNSFQLKYNCIPGDCKKATTFFGTQDPTPAICQTTASTGTLTCNGNGDSFVGDGSYEMYRFWQHLAIAGMIKGKYTGVAGSAGNYQHILGVNAPATGLPGAGFGFSYLYFKGAVQGSTYAIDYGNLFWLGNVVAGGSLRPQVGLFNPSEAKDFDKKIDDGKPGTGLVIARSNPAYTTAAWGTADACTTSTDQNDFTGNYNIASNAKNCAFMIKAGSAEN